LSLDDPRNPLHAALVENDDHPGWSAADLAAARAQEAADDAAAEAAWRDRELCESPEAVEAYWSGVFAQMPEWVRRGSFVDDHS
jgi:hypothetical protein